MMWVLSAMAAALLVIHSRVGNGRGDQHRLLRQSGLSNFAHTRAPETHVSVLGCLGHVYMFLETAMSIFLAK
jgi:hypothetical protein